jgi:hypothetical protein
MTTTAKTDREWIRDVLEARGYKQRDLAKLWGCSEAAASRFLNGLDSGDIPASRAYPLSRMLGMTLDELFARLGFAGGTVNLPPPQSTSIPVGTVDVKPHDGRIRALLHLDLSPALAGELMGFLAHASGTDATNTSAPPGRQK